MQTDPFGDFHQRLAVAISILALALDWSQTPYSHAWPHELSYTTFRENRLPSVEEPGSSRLVVVITNSSLAAAHDVRLLVHPVTGQAIISSTSLYDVCDAPRGKKLIHLRKIEARSSVEVEVTENRIEAIPELRKSWGIIPRYHYAPDVDSIHSEFGVVLASPGSCQERISYLPGDGRLL
jgi:hypothetical protein